MLDQARSAAWVLLPPAGLLWSGALGVLIALRWRRVGITVAALSVFGLVVLAMPLTSYALLSLGEVATEADPATLIPSESAIVVLGADVLRGAPEYGDITVGALTLERLRYAARLQRRTGLPLLVSGGPLAADDPPLAVLMKETLRRDFQVEVRWTEERSRNTAENLRFAAEILHRNEKSSVLLVTHAWHMRRALMAAHGLGLTVVPAPTLALAGPTGIKAVIPNIVALHESYLGIHELVGRYFYALVQR